MNSKDGAWIFLSHSHKDLEKVREIRNEFEKLGHNPLMFFLKCLTDESELDDLIRREIKERNWFILCDSTNAKSSKWVQEEVELIKSLNGKVFKQISLDEDFEKQIKNIIHFSRRTRVFISYSSRDTEIAEKISTRLQKHEYTVLGQNEISIGDNWGEKLNDSIEKVSKYGFFLLLVNKDTYSSQFAIRELELATKKNINIIPVYLDSYDDLKEYLPPDFSIFNGVDFSNDNFDLNMTKLISHLKAGEVRSQHIDNILTMLDKKDNTIMEYYIRPGMGKAYILLNLILVMQLELKEFNNVMTLVLTDRNMACEQYIHIFRTKDTLQIGSASTSEHFSQLLQSNINVIISTIQSVSKRITPCEKKIIIFVDANMGKAVKSILSLQKIFPNSRIITFTSNAVFNNNMKEVNLLANDMLNAHRKEVKMKYIKCTHEKNIIEMSKFIISHYRENIRPNGFKGIIVCANQLEAIAYQKVFLELKKQGKNPFNSKVIISGSNMEEYSSFFVPKPEVPEMLFKFNSGVNKSHNKVDKLNDISLLIVVNKLLVGYDAPFVQGYYLNKTLNFHTVEMIKNNLYRPFEEKKIAYIVDCIGTNEKYFNKMVV